MAFDLLRSNSSAGEPEWEDLYRRHAADLRRLIARRVPVSASVDDLLQETFYQAYRSRDRLDPSRPVWPWLATLAHRVCIAWWRRQRPEDAPWGVKEPVDLAVFPGSDEHLTAMVRGEQVASALAQLSPRHRFLLVGHTSEGLSCERLARFEGSSAKAVKSALDRARTHFRRHLGAADGNGWGLPVGIVVGMKRWYARYQRALPLAEGVGPWASAVVALGVVATLSIAPVTMRAERRSQHVSETHAPAAVDQDPARMPVVPSTNGAAGAPRTAGVDRATQPSGAGRNASGATPVAGVRTSAEVTHVPEGVWTLYEVTIDAPIPVVGGSMTVGGSMRCTSGVVATYACAVGRMVPDEGS